MSKPISNTTLCMWCTRRKNWIVHFWGVFYNSLP
jgi:hypothetical protein